MPYAWRLTLSVLVWSLLLPVSTAFAEPPLQGIFDGFFGPGVIRVPQDDTGAETFTPGTRRNEILVEFAGNAANNTFGWYPLSNPGQLNTIFGGSDGPGTPPKVVAITDAFGIFSSTPDGLWRSQSGLNDDGSDHFQTYAYPGVSGGFLAAMEDLRGGGDQDFNDMVVSVRPFDTAAPMVDLTFLPANGQNGWFVTTPVTGTVSADDTTTGGSAITAITCTGATVGPIDGLGTPVANAPVTVAGDGVHDITCSATDAADNTGASPPRTVRIDATAPSVQALPYPAADLCSAPGTPGWCRGTQTAGFEATDATSEVASPCSGRTCTFTRSTEINGSAVLIPSGPVSDVAGNTIPGTDAGPYMIDSVVPDVVITVPADGQTYLLNAAVASDYSCADTTSGVASCVGPVADGANFDTVGVGPHSFTVTAADVAGNTAQRTHAYKVVYHFDGFFPPVDNLPTVNTVKAGSAVPVKFSLAGNQGLNIFAAGYPASQQTNCDSGATENAIEQTVSAGSSTLTYDPTTNQYHYTWKTDKTWAGTCRQLVVRLNDGTDHLAIFKFK